MAKPAPKTGTTAKHDHAKKHATAPKKKHAAKPAKHHPVVHHKTTKTAVHKAPTGGGGGAGGSGGGHAVAKPRKLSIADVACCSAEAVAASARLAGFRITDDDVLTLYCRTAAGPDDGATIPETIRAAALYGIGPARVADAVLSEPLSGCIAGYDLTVAQADQSQWRLENAPEWGPHAAVIAGDGLVTWGRYVLCDEEFLLSAAEAWQLTWETAGGMSS
jgi:hypothetical protein